MRIGQSGGVLAKRQQAQAIEQKPFGIAHQVKSFHWNRFAEMATGLYQAS